MARARDPFADRPIGEDSPIAVRERLTLTVLMFEQATEELRALLTGFYPQPGFRNAQGELMSQPFDDGAAVYLGDRLDRMINESQKLRTDVAAAEAQRAREAARRRQQNMIAYGILGVLTALMVLLILLVWQTIHTARENAQKLEDCLYPQGYCAQRIAGAHEQAVQDQFLVQLFTIECARENSAVPGDEFNRQFEACVVRKYAEAKRPGVVGPGLPRPGQSPSVSPSVSPSPSASVSPVPSVSPSPSPSPSPGPSRTP